MDRWEYLGNGVCKRGKDELRLSRVRDPGDLTEMLRIVIHADGKEYAPLDFDFLTWESEVKELVRYGIYFDSGDKYKVKSFIKANFADIPVKEGVSNKEKKDAEIKSLYKMFCYYIKEHTSEDEKDENLLIIKDNTYCVPLDQFEKELAGSTSNIKPLELRMHFAKKEYTEHNEMRTDKMVKNSAKKSIRCIVFKAEKVEKEIEEIKKKEKEKEVADKLKGGVPVGK